MCVLCVGGVCHQVGTSDVQIHVSRPQLQKMMEQNSRKVRRAEPYKGQEHADPTQSVKHQRDRVSSSTDGGGVDGGGVGVMSVKAITEGLQNAHRRLRKHISDDSGLFMPLWDRLTTLLFQRFSR